MRKLIFREALTIFLVIMLVFSTLLIITPSKVSATAYTSCSVRGPIDPVWANSVSGLYIVVSNSGDTGVNVNVELDYDETYMTITSCKALSMCVEYQGVDNGDTIKWNNVYVPSTPRPSGGPIDNCYGQMFSATVNAIIDKCTPNGMEIVNKVWYERLDNGHRYGPKKGKIVVINPQICGFNVDHKAKLVDGETEWSDELYADINDIIAFKTEIKNNGADKVYVSSVRNLLPPGLEYVPGTGKVDYSAKEPSVKELMDGRVKVGFKLTDKDSKLLKIGLVKTGETLTIKFNAKVTEHGTLLSESTAVSSLIDYISSGYRALFLSDTVTIFSTDAPPEDPVDPDPDPVDPDPIEGTGEPIVQVIKPELGVLYINEREIPTQLKKIFVIGPLTISANAIDLDGDITKVEFKVNNEIKQTYSEPPYDFVYDEKGFGLKSISIKAYDDSGLASEKIINLFILNLGK